MARSLAISCRTRRFYGDASAGSLLKWPATRLFVERAQEASAILHADRAQRAFRCATSAAAWMGFRWRSNWRRRA